MRIEIPSDVRFDEQVEATLQKIRHLLIVKGQEYRRNNDVYHNFNVGAKMTNLSPERVLHGFLLKHLVSMADIRDDIDAGVDLNPDRIEEKWTDALVYLVIEKCMILDRIEKHKQKLSEDED